MEMKKDNRYWWYRSHGICVECGQESAIPGSIYCDNCHDRCRARIHKTYLRRRQDPEKVAHDNARRRELHAERKAAGLCTMCGRAAMPGRTMCAEHAEITRRRKKNWLIKKAEAQGRRIIPIDVRYGMGICRWCEQPVVPGKHFCETHLATEQRIAANMRRYICTDNHPFRIADNLSWAERCAKK